MIFLTVGSSDPFDRMVRAVDEWAGSRGRTDVFAQIGKARYEPQYMDAVPFLSPSEFRERVRAARLLVAHAGMGSIITALEAGKPIIIMPKWARLGEHRSDHQVATAKRLGQKPGIVVAWDEEDLIVKLDREGGLCAPETIAREASPELIAAIREFLSCGKLPMVKSWGQTRVETGKLKVENLIGAGSPGKPPRGSRLA